LCLGQIANISSAMDGQGHRQKNFQEGTKKRQKNSKIPKNSTIKPLPGVGGGATEKRLKYSKKDRKIALLSLYLLYLSHV